MNTKMSVPAFLLPALMKTGLDFSIDAVEVLKSNGINPKRISMDSGRIPAEKFNTVMEDLVRQTRNPGLGIAFAHHFSYQYLPEIESYLLSTSTMKEAMLAYRWMADLFDSGIKVEFISSDTLYTVKLTFLPDTPYWLSRLFSECSFTLVARLAAQKAGSDFRIYSVSFAHNDAAAVAVYQNTFRCRVYINHDHYSISLPLKEMNKPLEQHSPALKSLSRVQAEQKVESLVGEKTLIESIRTILIQHPYIIAEGLNECAARLYLSPRTLQRKLKQQNSSYRKEVEFVREELAKNYLKTTASLERISEILCFSDRRSFTRAFQKWTGMSPSAFRSNL